MRQFPRRAGALPLPHECIDDGKTASPMKKWLSWIGLGLVAGFGLLLLLGVTRYGGIDGLRLRVRAEMAAHMEQEVLVPTPLPTPTAEAQVESAPAAAAATITPALAPTEAPSATLSPTQPSAGCAASATATAAQSSTTPTAGITATTIPTASPEATSVPAHQPAVPAVELGGLRHEWQTWNNCGPATLAMYLSYFGSSLTQAEIGPVIRPNPEDKHASVQQLAAYARSQGLSTLVRVNGDADRLRLLLSNGIPVMMPSWHVDAKGSAMGHYRLVTGYDDAREEWVLYDSLESHGVSADQLYRGVRLSYQSFDAWWQVFNRRYFVIYTAEMEPAVLAIVGDDLNDQAMWERSLEQAQREVEARPEDPFAWFTLGTNLVAAGRPADAAAAYDRARLIGLPFRMMWYQFGAFQAYYDSGRYEEVIALADATIKVTAEVEELHYWRGRALAALGDVEGARQAFQRALAQRPDFPEAVGALEQLGG